MNVVAFAFLGVLVGALSMWTLLYTPELMPEKVEEQVAGQPLSNAFTLSHATPTRIRIPSVDLTATFEGPLGIHDDQTVEVPDSYEEVGWYKYGPTPGELGPAIVLGHVDSYEGPAVFWPLRKLKPEDQIFIDRIDGTTATFTVDRLEEYSQNGFPTDKVYGDLDYAGLRLITCSGVYNHGTFRYSHNLIVFAHLSE